VVVTKPVSGASVMALFWHGSERAAAFARLVR